MRSSKETTALRLDRTLLAAMRRVRAEDGIPVTTQIEKAVRVWLEKRGALTPNRPRGTARKRPSSIGNRR